MDQINDIFKTILNGQQARMAAAAVATVQIEHYKALEAAGLDPDIAVRLTVGTSTALLEGVSQITDAIASNAPAIAEAFDKIINRTTVTHNIT